MQSPNEKQRTPFEINGPSTWEKPGPRSPYSMIQQAEMARWVHQLAAWKVIAHHTFEWEASVWSAQKSYERFMAKSCREVSHFYALEQNPGRPGFHVHALWADCEAVQRSGIWQRWQTLYGRNRIEPVRGITDVARYCSKYVTKEGAWWNVKLVSPDLWHGNAARQVRSSPLGSPPMRTPAPIA